MHVCRQCCGVGGVSESTPCTAHRPGAEASMQEPEGWQTAGKPAKKSSGGGAPKGACIVGWGGDWLCKCGSQHRALANCRVCGLQAPCRDYLRGACPSAKLCRYPHLPFNLPTATPPSNASSRIDLCVAPEAPAFAERSQQAAPAGQQRTLRTISWFGDWACPCGEDNLFREATCRTCKRSGPCREWVRGRCKFSDCRFPHAPFDLPPNKPERALNSKEGVVARPPPGAEVVRAAAPAKVEAPAASAPAPSAAVAAGGGGQVAGGGTGGQLQGGPPVARSRTVLLVRRPGGGHEVVPDAAVTVAQASLGPGDPAIAAPRAQGGPVAPAAPRLAAAPGVPLAAAAPGVPLGGRAYAAVGSVVAAAGGSAVAGSGAVGLGGLSSALAGLTLAADGGAAVGVPTLGGPWSWGGAAAVQQPVAQQVPGAGGLPAAAAAAPPLPDYGGSSLFSYGGVCGSSS